MATYGIDITTGQYYLMTSDSGTTITDPIAIPTNAVYGQDLITHEGYITSSLTGTTITGITASPSAYVYGKDLITGKPYTTGVDGDILTLQFYGGGSTTVSRKDNCVTIYSSGGTGGSSATGGTCLNGLGFVKANGTAITYDNSAYSLTSHSHNISGASVAYATTSHVWDRYIDGDGTSGANAWLMGYDAVDAKWKPISSTVAKNFLGTVNNATNADNAVNADKLDTYHLSDIKTWVGSRGENLVSNGTALMGNNTNFSVFLFNGANANNSPASFSIGNVNYASAGSDEFMPVDATKTYKVSMDMKSKLGQGFYFFFLNMYDVDKNSITAQNHMYVAGTTTTLAQDLKNGDTVVYLTSAANWVNSAGTAEYNRNFIIWDYQNSYGYKYDKETYSRHYMILPYVAGINGGDWLDGSVNYGANTITLRVPYVGSTITAGTWVSNNSAGGTYKYLWAGTLTQNWTNYTALSTGIDFSGQNVSTKFSPATAYVKMGWLVNYSAVQNEEFYVTNITLNQAFVETDTLQSVTTRGATTDKPVTINNNLAAQKIESNNTSELQLKITNSYTGGGSWGIAVNANNWSNTGGGGKLLFTPTGNDYDSKLTLQQDGNVGIGTTAPEAALDVNGNILIANSGAIQTRLSYSPYTIKNKITFGLDSQMNLCGIGTLQFNNRNYIAQNSPVDFSETIFTGSGSDIPAMTWRENGSVGIGTTSPTSKLTVGEPTGTYRSTLSDYVMFYGADSVRGQVGLYSTDIAAVNKGGSFSFGGENAVGVGGTSPYIFAQVKGAKEGAANTYNGYLSFSTTTTSSAIYERMRITSAGNVGIGTQDPQATLDVSGNTKVGSAANYVELNSSGITLNGSATVFDDLVVPLQTGKLGANAKPDFDYTNLGYLFPQNDTSEILYLMIQLPHNWKQGSDVFPHIHYNRTSAGNPTFKITYSWFNIGSATSAPSTTINLDTEATTYSSGSIHQINKSSAAISGSGKTISSMLLIKLFRDDNTVTGDVLAYEFDLHYEIDSLGSRDEYVK